MRCSEKELNRFRELVKGMTYQTRVFAMLKEELSKKGYWKNKKKWKPPYDNFARNLAKQNGAEYTEEW